MVVKILRMGLEDGRDFYQLSGLPPNIDVRRHCFKRIASSQCGRLPPIPGTDRLRTLTLQS